MSNARPVWEAWKLSVPSAATVTTVLSLVGVETRYRVLAEGLNRALGGEHVFTDDVDVDKRKAYEARARGEE